MDLEETVPRVALSSSWKGYLGLDSQKKSAFKRIEMTSLRGQVQVVRLLAPLILR